MQRLRASGLMRGQLPPTDKVKGALRFLDIEDTDVNACGGTHLRCTSEIQVQLWGRPRSIWDKLLKPSVVSLECYQQASPTVPTKGKQRRQ